MQETGCSVGWSSHYNYQAQVSSECRCESLTRQGGVAVFKRRSPDWYLEVLTYLPPLVEYQRLTHRKPVLLQAPDGIVLLPESPQVTLLPPLFCKATGNISASVLHTAPEAKRSWLQLLLDRT
jgi:hypothetical protein